MKSLSVRILTAAAVVIVIVGLAGCMNPLARSSSGAKVGSLTVSFTNAINSRTLLPGTSMNAGSYSITGSGPGGASFSGSSTGNAVSFTKLAFGTWTVTVDAYNDASPAVMIGSGTGTADVPSGGTTDVTVTVVPLSGTGTLSLNVSWNAADIETPSIDASLIPTTGTTRTLDFIVSGASASFSASDVATGYHTLTLQLLDNGIVTAGAVELVRIVKDAITNGTFAFTQVNKPGGTINVNIDPQLADPIDVTLSGASSSITVGQTMTVSASVPAGTPNVSYVWYVNGASVGTGSPFTFGSTLAAGHYRLDVTAITADGTRAGSATASFDVVPGTPTTSTTVTYNGNGNDSGSAPVDGNSYLQGATVTVLGPGDLGKTGYSFAGWNTAADGSGTAYAENATFAMGSTNVTLYAQWTAVSVGPSVSLVVQRGLTGEQPNALNVNFSSSSDPAVSLTGLVIDVGSGNTLARTTGIPCIPPPGVWIGEGTSVVTISGLALSPGDTFSACVADTLGQYWNTGQTVTATFDYSGSTFDLTAPFSNFYTVETTKTAYISEATLSQ